MALSSKWFEGFRGDAKQKEELERTIRGSNHVLNMLTEIIDREIKQLEATSSNDYDKPNWPLRAADKNGALRQLKLLRTLTHLDKVT
jgi:hypothetical protein